MVSRLLLPIYKLQTLFRKICNIYSVSKTNFVECMNPHFVFVRYFTHDQICNPKRDYN